MLSPSYNPALLARRGREEADRRQRERTSFAEGGVQEGVRYLPLDTGCTGTSKVAFLDESGHPFVIRNRSGEDTALVLSRSSYVLLAEGQHPQFGPYSDVTFYPGPVGRLAADLNTIAGFAFGGRAPYRHADVADFGERIDARKILEAANKTAMWEQVRTLWSTGTVDEGDTVLVDGGLNVVQTPAAASADEINRDLWGSGIVLAGLSKQFGPKCEDIVYQGRLQHPGQPFIFTIPPDRILNAHRGAEGHEMILTLGPKGRTLGLQFGSSSRRTRLIWTTTASGSATGTMLPTARLWMRRAAEGTRSACTMASPSLMHS